MSEDWRVNYISSEDAQLTTATEQEQEETPPNKRRLVLMGEFSAGKSTLTNILLDSQPLPMKVTATRLPPVLITHGTPASFAVGHDGEREEIGLGALEDVSLEDTAYIEVHMEAEVLELCDIVDMPGISDPNMPQEMWENVIEQNDHVIWCTHATQAWRQSEAAIWNTLKDQSSGANLLLITQFDKLQNDRDKARVIKRIERETEGLFDAIYPVSLLAALEAGNDYAVWKSSGAADFSEHVIRMLMQQAAPRDDIAPQANDLRRPSAERVDLVEEQEPSSSEPRITPRRVLARPARQAVGRRWSEDADTEEKARL
ncbi:MAG: dynamin family protein [Pseudomonadota bacterium]